MTLRERNAAISHIDKAAKILAKHGVVLGNGGDIASMLSGISSDLAMMRTHECEELREA